MSKINVNFKLYKAKALLNLRYDNMSYKEGQELEIRPPDIAELTERGYVEMIETSEENQGAADTTITPPPVNENTNTEETEDKEEQITQGGE